MHKCQGTSQLLLLPGQTPNRTYRLRDSILDKDGVAPKSMFDGIDVERDGVGAVRGRASACVRDGPLGENRPRRR